MAVEERQSCEQNEELRVCGIGIVGAPRRSSRGQSCAVNRRTFGLLLGPCRAVRSPPCAMKPSITRWNSAIVNFSRASSFTRARVGREIRQLDSEGAFGGLHDQVFSGSLTGRKAEQGGEARGCNW